MQWRNRDNIFLCIVMQQKQEKKKKIFQMVKKNLKDSGNTFRIVLSLIKRPSGFVKDCQVFTFQRKDAQLCDSDVMVIHEWLRLEEHDTSAENTKSFCCRRTAEGRNPPQISIFTKFSEEVVFCLYMKKTRGQEQFVGVFFSTVPQKQGEQTPQMLV